MALGTKLGIISSTFPQIPSFNNIYSLAFDGVDDFLNTSAVDLGETNTISLWFKNNSANTGNGVIGDADNHVVYFQTVNLFYYPVGSVTGRKAFGGTNIANAMADTTNWHNLIFIRKAPTNGISGYNDLACYLDGNLEGTFADIYTANINLIPVYIGKSGLVSSNTYDGLIDEVSYYNNDQTANVSTISTSPVVDLTSLNPVAWWRMGDNGTFKSPQWLIPNNENKNKFSNYSFEYDGVDDYINTGASTLNSETALTISAWIYPTAYGDATAPSFVSTDAASPRAFYLGLFNGTNFRFSLSTDGSNLTSLDTASSTVDLNVWQHILVTWDQVNLKLYKNGVLLKTVATTFASNGTFTTTNDLLIGARRSDSGFFEGKIDEVAIWNSVQDASTIYNSGVPKEITGAVGYWRSEQSNFTDNWLVNNSALSNYSTRSFNFDGVDDTITLSSSMSTSGTDWSISCWIKTTQTGGNRVILSGSSGSGASKYFGVNFGKLTFFSSDNSFDITSLLSVNDGNWHNILFTYNYTSGAWILYIDGSVDTSQTATTGIDIPTWNTFSSRLGARFYSGNIDECSYFNSIVNASTIYNGGEPTTITGAVAHWRMGEDATFSTNWNVPDQVGSNNGTSANMTIADLEGNAPNYTGGGLSNNMTIEDRVGDAPNSTSNALSYNMDEADRETDVPT